MAKEGLPTKLRDLSECLWWDMGYEENHTHKDDRALLVEAADRIEALEKAVAKIGAIRDSIIEHQNVNWSAHIYPLVAALNEVGPISSPANEAKEE